VVHSKTHRQFAKDERQKEMSDWGNDEKTFSFALFDEMPKDTSELVTTGFKRKVKAKNPDKALETVVEMFGDDKHVVIMYAIEDTEISELVDMRVIFETIMKNITTVTQSSCVMDTSTVSQDAAEKLRRDVHRAFIKFQKRCKLDTSRNWLYQAFPFEREEQ